MKFFTTTFALLCLFCLSAQLSGTYTINPDSPTKKTNYNSFSDAFSDAKYKGLEGDVVFEIKENTYYEPLILEGIYNESDFTITIKSENSSKIEFENDGLALLLSNSNNIVIENLSFKSKSSSFNNLVQLENANHIEIRNCVFSATDINKSDMPLVSINYTSTNNLFENNSFKGASGILISKLSNENKIISNRFYINEKGIEIKSSQNQEIFSNTIKGSLHPADVAITLDGFVGNTIISSNAVSNINVGLSQTKTFRPSDSKFSGSIVNNVFNCQNTAIQLTNNIDGLKIAFNTLETSNNSVLVVNEEINNTISNIEILANNFTSKSQEPIIEMSSKRYVSKINFNNIYGYNNGFHASIDGQSVLKLENWKSLVGSKNSISADPMYVAIGDSKYLVSENSPCIDAGPNAENIGVLTDYDGDLRGQVTEIGADEFNSLAIENVKKLIQLAMKE